MYTSTMNYVAYKWKLVGPQKGAYDLECFINRGINRSILERAVPTHPLTSV